MGITFELWRRHRRGSKLTASSGGAVDYFDLADRRSDMERVLIEMLAEVRQGNVRLLSVVATMKDGSVVRQHAVKQTPRPAKAASR